MAGRRMFDLFSGRRPQQTIGKVMYDAIETEMRGPIGQKVQRYVHESEVLRRSWPASVSKKIIDFIAAEGRKGRRAKDIAQEVKDNFPTEAAAPVEVLVRTVIGVASTAFERARAEEIGVTWYTWETSQDQRVRASHAIMQDVMIAWTNPPSPEELVGEESLGRYHAGEGLACRCLPMPVIDLDSLEWPRKMYTNGKIITVTRKQFEKLG